MTRGQTVNATVVTPLRDMETVLFVFGFPSCVALTWAILFLNRHQQGLVTSVLVCATTLAAGWWSIWQSRFEARLCGAK